MWGTGSSIGLPPSGTSQAGFTEGIIQSKAKVRHFKPSYCEIIACKSEFFLLCFFLDVCSVNNYNNINEPLIN